MTEFSDLMRQGVPGGFSRIITQATANRNESARGVAFVGTAKGGSFGVVNTYNNPSLAVRELRGCRTLDNMLLAWGAGAGTVKFVRIGETTNFTDVVLRINDEYYSIYDYVKRQYGDINQFYLDNDIADADKFGRNLYDAIYLVSNDMFQEFTLKYHIGQQTHTALGTYRGPTVKVRYYTGIGNDPNFPGWSPIVDAAYSDTDGEAALTLDGDSQTYSWDLADVDDWDETSLTLEDGSTVSGYIMALTVELFDQLDGSSKADQNAVDDLTLSQDDGIYSPIFSHVVQRYGALPSYGVLKGFQPSDPDGLIVAAGLDYNELGASNGSGFTANTTFRIECAEDPTIFENTFTGSYDYSSTTVTLTDSPLDLTGVNVGDSVDLDGTSLGIIRRYDEDAKTLWVTGGDATDDIGSGTVTIIPYNALKKGSLLYRADTTPTDHTYIYLGTVLSVGAYQSSDGHIDVEVLSPYPAFVDDATYAYSGDGLSTESTIKVAIQNPPPDVILIESREYSDVANNITVDVAAYASKLKTTVTYVDELLGTGTTTWTLKPGINDTTGYVNYDTTDFIAAINEGDSYITMEDLSGVNAAPFPTEVELVGGTNGDGTVYLRDYINGFATLLDDEDVYYVLPVIEVDDARSIDDHNAIFEAMMSHVGMACGSTFQRYRIGFHWAPEHITIGKISENNRWINGSLSGTYRLSGSDRLVYSYQKARTISSVTGVSASGRDYFASIAAGLCAGLSVPEPGTFKVLSTLLPDVLPSKDTWGVLVENGVFAAVRRENAYSVLRSINSLGPTELLGEISIRTSVDVLDTVMRETIASKYVGQVAEAAITNRVATTAQALLNSAVRGIAEGGLIRAWRNLTVEENPAAFDRIDVSYEILPKLPINQTTSTMSVTSERFDSLGATYISNTTVIPVSTGG